MQSSVTMISPGALERGVRPRCPDVDGDPRDSDTEFVVMYPPCKFALLERYMNPPRGFEVPSPEEAIFRQFAEAFPENRGSRHVCSVPTALYLEELLEGEKRLVEGPGEDGGYRFI